ncbi:MAG: hypothetical protein JWO94_271, partial [Verrucomicrobiaceae bacterium]|nr:hypothetical protein [Verrucomicrobiaceae bacterium]
AVSAAMSEQHEAGRLFGKPQLTFQQHISYRNVEDFVQCCNWGIKGEIHGFAFYYRNPFS